MRVANRNAYWGRYHRLGGTFEEEILDDRNLAKNQT